MFEHVCNPSYIETDGQESAEQTINSALSYKPSGKNYEDSGFRRQLTDDLSVLPDLPGPENAQLPNGWLLEENTLALYLETRNAPILVSHQPIVVKVS
jgi:hypothetical protein